MGRKKGFDAKKISSIISILLKNQNGIWIREIGRQTSLHPTTVTKYIEGVLSSLVEDVSLGNTDKHLLRVIKLKPFVIERLEQGQSLDKIMKMLNLMNKIA